MLKKLKKIVLFCFLAFVGILLLFTALIYFNQDVLKERAIVELNKFLAEPVQIGSVDISFKKFPKAAILLENVYSKGAFSSDQDTLLSAEQVYLEFHLWHIWNSPLSIDQISVESGTLDIKMRDNQRDNFRIWKDTDTTEKSTLFGLEAIVLHNMQVNYSQGAPEVRIKSFQDQAHLSGAFTENGYTFSVEQKGFLQTLYVDNKLYARSIPLSSSLHIAQNEDAITLSKGAGIAADIPLAFEGFFNQERIDFNVSGKKLSGEQLFQIAREQGYVDVALNEVNGKVDAQLRYTQQNNRDETTIKGRLSDGVISHNLYEIRHAAADFNFAYRNDISSLELNNISLPLGSGTATGALKIVDFDHPKTSGNLAADLSLSDWKRIFPLDTVQEESGRIAVNTTFSIAFAKMGNVSTKDLANANINGNITLNDLNFRLKDAPNTINNLRGQIKIEERNVTLKELYLQTGKSDLFVDGELKNLLNWLYFEDEKLAIDGRLKAQEFQLEDIISGGESSSPDEYDLSFTKNISMQLSLDVLKFSFSSFHAQNVSGNFEGRNAVFYGNNLRMQTCGGNIEANFTLNTAAYPYLGEGNLQLAQVDVQELFTNFQNFGQEVLTAKNLKGKTTATLSGRGAVDKSLSVITESIVANAEIYISKGELNGFEPLKALSDYAEVQELENIRFSDMQNTIHIENSLITIPKMLVKNNVFDLSVKGTHTFENQINYSVGLKMGDVLFGSRKKKKGSGEFDEFLTERKDEDDPTIYIKMTGPIDNPEMSIDKAAIGQSIKQDLKDQGQELKDILKKSPEEKKKKGSGIIYTWPDEDDG
jgi:hypothetical protein